MEHVSPWVWFIRVNLWGLEQAGQEPRGEWTTGDLRCRLSPWTVLVAFCYPFFGTSCVCVCVCVCVCARARLCIFGSLTLQWQGPYGPKCETENISLPYSLIHRQGARTEATP